MGKPFFDYEDVEFCYAASDGLAFNANGDMLMRMGDNMAMNLDSGEIHMVSGWTDEKDEDDDRSFA